MPFLGGTFSLELISFWVDFLALSKFLGLIFGLG